MASHRPSFERVQGHGQEIRLDGGLLAQTQTIDHAAEETDGFTPVIDEWLQAAWFMPRKQRHTAKRVYDRTRHGERVHRLVFRGAALREAMASRTSSRL